MSNCNIFATANDLLSAKDVSKVVFEIERGRNGELTVVYRAICVVNAEDREEITEIKSCLNHPLFVKAKPEALDDSFLGLLERCMSKVATTAKELPDIEKEFEAAEKAAADAKKKAVSKRPSAENKKTKGKGKKTTTPKASEVAGATAAASGNSVAPKDTPSEKQSELFDI